MVLWILSPTLYQLNHPFTPWAEAGHNLSQNVSQFVPTRITVRPNTYHSSSQNVSQFAPKRITVRPQRAVACSNSSLRTKTDFKVSLCGTQPIPNRPYRSQAVSACLSMKYSRLHVDPRGQNVLRIACNHGPKPAICKPSLQVTRCFGVSLYEVQPAPRRP